MEPVLNGGIGGKPAAASETNVQKLTAAGKHIFVHRVYVVTVRESKTRDLHYSSTTL